VIFVQPIFVMFFLEPTAVPRARDSQAQPDRMNFLSHTIAKLPAWLQSSRFCARRGVKSAGYQKDTKKAIVTLKAGQKIELGGVNYFEQ
ncbi:MAG: hypothetical protein ACREP1_10840, partial [Rhodanobacteraceae bacterium]